VKVVWRQAPNHFPTVYIARKLGEQIQIGPVVSKEFYMGLLQSFSQKRESGPMKRPAFVGTPCMAIISDCKAELL